MFEEILQNLKLEITKLASTYKQFKAAKLQDLERQSLELNLDLPPLDIDDNSSNSQANNNTIAQAVGDKNFETKTELPFPKKLN